MNRSEIRKRAYIFALAVLLMLSLPLADLRMADAVRRITGREILRITGTSGTVLDRYGTVLCGSGDYPEDIMGNVLGGRGMTGNTLVECYGRELAPGPFGIFGGLKDLEGVQANRMHTSLLPMETHRLLAEQMDGHRGIVYAYNYKTGEIYVMLSLPSSASDTDVEGALLNKVLNGKYIPGSIMKIVTSLCALEQSLDLEQLAYECRGQEELPDGKTVICNNQAVHGPMTITDALGYSCNCTFASLAQQLDPARTVQTLRQMGFVVNGAGDRTERMGDMYRQNSSISFSSLRSSQDIWSFIGQGTAEITPAHLTMIAAAVANHGEAARPGVVKCFENPNTDETTPYHTTEFCRLFSGETADRMDAIWTAATDRYYRGLNGSLDQAITYAKTGTAQYGGDRTNRTLMGCMKELDTAFLIVVEDLPGGNNLALDVANTLARMLPEPAR